MAVEIRKRENETVSAMLRRFNRRVQQSGILLRARKSRFFEVKPNKRKRRESAIYRARMLKEIERLKKLGKLEEEKKR